MTFGICSVGGTAGNIAGARLGTTPKKNWGPSVATVKAVIKFFMDTKNLTHNNIESDGTEGSVED